MIIVNLTSHIVRLNNGKEYQPSGIVARVPLGKQFTKGIPPFKEGVQYILSTIAKKGSTRKDTLCPVTWSKKVVKRDGAIYSVPSLSLTVKGG